LISRRFEGRGFRREEDEFDEGTNSKQNNRAAKKLQSVLANVGFDDESWGNS
jgi:hypothetical protein